MLPPSVFRVAKLSGLILGHTIHPTTDGLQRLAMIKPAPGKRTDWTIPTGVYTPYEIVAGAAPLLETVLLHLDRSADGRSSRKLLVDGLASSLSLNSRESTLPLPTPITNAARKEVAKHAERISQTLVGYARDAAVPDFNSPTSIRSPCEGHIWTQQVASLLLGPRSNGQLMQLYNEWLHQMALLRDALLPFQNYKEVLIPISTESGPGLRHFETAREQLLLQTITRSVSQKTIVDAAKALLAPKLPAGGYALQYSHGLIVPAFLAGCSSLHLLRWCPVQVDSSASELLFDYQYSDYYSAPRVDTGKPVGTLAAGAWLPADGSASETKVAEASCESRKMEASNGKSSLVRMLKLRISFDKGEPVEVDVGQIARGRRYAYQGQRGNSTQAEGSGFSRECVVHDAATVLARSGGLLTSDDGLHVIPTTNPVLALALLGKIYPENVVMLGASQAPGSAEGVGKGFGPKFVIYGGICGEAEGEVC